MRGYKAIIRHGTRFFIGSMVFNIGNLLYWFILRVFLNYSDIGYAVTVFSIASLISTIINPGLTMSLLRDIGSRGLRAYLSALVISAIMLGPGIPLAIVLLSVLYTGLQSYTTVTVLLVILMYMFITHIYSLMGLEKSVHVMASYTSFTLLRIALTILLIYMGYGLDATFYGTIASYTIIIPYMSIVLLNSWLKNANPNPGKTVPTLKDLIDTLLLGLANYPYTISIQTYYSLGALIVAYTTGAPEVTGQYYFLLILLIAIQSIPVMYLNATLPYIVKSNKVEAVNHVLKSISALLSITITPLVLEPSIILKILLGENPFKENLVVQLILLSAIPVALFVTILVYYNYKRSLSAIFTTGLSRILSFTLLALILGRAYGVIGISASILLSNIIPVALAKVLGVEIRLAKPLESLLLQITVISVLTLIAIPEPLKPILSIALMLVLLHLLKITTLRELHELFLTLVSSFKKT